MLWRRWRLNKWETSHTHSHWGTQLHNQLCGVMNGGVLSVEVIHYNPWNQDTSLTKTHSSVPRVSRIKRFYCTHAQAYSTHLHSVRPVATCGRSHSQCGESMRDICGWGGSEERWRRVWGGNETWQESLNVMGGGGEGERKESKRKGEMEGEKRGNLGSEKHSIQHTRNLSHTTIHTCIYLHNDSSPIAFKLKTLWEAPDIHLPTNTTTLATTKHCACQCKWICMTMNSDWNIQTN